MNIIFKLKQTFIQFKLNLCRQFSSVYSFCITRHKIRLVVDIHAHSKGPGRGKIYAKFCRTTIYKCSK
jgi:hypothetical protein